MNTMFDEVAAKEAPSDERPFREVMNHWNDLSQADREAFAEKLKTENEVKEHPEAELYDSGDFDFTQDWTVKGGGILLPLRRRTVGELAWHVAEQIIKEVRITGDWYAETLMVLLPPNAPLPSCDSIATSWHAGSEAYHVGLSLLTKAGKHGTRTVCRKGYDGAFRDERLYVRDVRGYEILTVKTYHRKVIEKLMRQGIGDWGGCGAAFDAWLEQDDPVIADTIDLPGATFCVPGGAWSIDIHRAMKETERETDTV